MSEKRQAHVADREYSEDETQSNVMIDENCDVLRELETFTAVNPESRRQANLDSYVSLWLLILRTRLDASIPSERRDEEQEADHHGPADTKRLIEAGVCIPRATSEVVSWKRYKLQWPGRDGRRIALHQQVVLTPFAEDPPNTAYYLKVISKWDNSMIAVPMGGDVSDVMHDGIWRVELVPNLENL